AYLFHLTVVGIVLRWFSTSPLPLAWRLRTLLQRRAGPDVFGQGGRPPELELPSRSRPGALAVVFIVFAVVVSGHQLTPFVTLATVGMLVLLGLCPTRGLLVVMTVMVAGWILYEGWAFFSGH